jgi:S1-C subfamily serine protease
MYAEFRHLDGALAGTVRVVRKDFATIGRHPSADVPFDADRDLDVSGRHAAVFRQGDAWLVRDLGSTNGIWVNGVRLKGDRTLAPNDVLRFGIAGPQLRFMSHPGEPAAIPDTEVGGATREEATRGRPDRAATPRMGAPSGRTTERIRVEVRRQTTAWRRVTVVALVLAAIALAGVVWTTARRDRALAAERAQLLERTDSLMTRLLAASTSAVALQAALQRAREETERLRASIASGRVTSDRLDTLSGQVATSAGRHEAVLRAAGFDLETITRTKGDAIALVVSEFADGRRVAGTGFAVQARGDTGWIATSRHLVVDAAGRPAQRLGVIFNGSSQNFRAEFAAAAETADLALLTVRVRSGVPSVKAFSAGVTPGEPVAVLGFPFGFDFPIGGDWRKLGVSVVSFPGTIRRADTSMVELDGYGTNGSSGSPVFNAAGEVAGVVYGGESGSFGRVVYAVPVRVVVELLSMLSRR